MVQMYLVCSYAAVISLSYIKFLEVQNNPFVHVYLYLINPVAQNKMRTVKKLTAESLGLQNGLLL